MKTTSFIINSRSEDSFTSYLVIITVIIVIIIILIIIIINFIKMPCDFSMELLI